MLRLLPFAVSLILPAYKFPPPVFSCTTQSRLSGLQILNLFSEIFLRFAKLLLKSS
jgi:hypothetical protein